MAIAFYAEDIELPERYKDVRTIGNAMTPDMEILSQINPIQLHQPL